MLLDDLLRDRVHGWIGPQLQEEAFLDVPRAHADRVELLDHLGQDALDLLHGVLAARGDLAELGAQVAVLVDVADDLLADPPGARVLERQPELVLQVVGERRRGPDHVLERQVLAVLLGDERALLAGVEHDLEGIVGQIVRLPLGDGRLRGDRLDGRGRRRVGRRGPVRRVTVLGRRLLEQRVLEELLLDDLLELERGELQELDRLLEQRGHDDPLALLQGEARLHGHRSTLPCLQREPLAEIDLAGDGVAGDFGGGARHEDLAVVEDVRPVGDREGLTHVVVGDEDADPALA